MKLSPKTARRPGFTLVEMMVVLAIIIVLVSLVAGAVLRIMGIGPQVQAQSEISHLNQAVELFKQKYGIYPPSKVFLANNLSDYQTAYNYYSTRNPPDLYNMAVINNSWPVTSGSAQYLVRIFPKMLMPSGPPANQSQVTTLTIDWTGGQYPILATDPNRWKGTFLEGDQCLVFFLGGMQTFSQPGNIPTCLGFAANSNNPTSMSNTNSNYPPLYDFPSTRLTTVTRGYLPLFNQNQNNFFVYKDPFGTNVPYIYYSSYGNRNAYQTLDCASQVSLSLSQPVTPYYEATSPTTQYLNKNTFQIISAGADGDFGAGGLWNPGLQPVDRPTTDNQSNFNNGGLMGTRS